MQTAKSRIGVAEVVSITLSAVAWILPELHVTAKIGSTMIAFGAIVISSTIPHSRSDLTENIIAGLCVIGSLLLAVGIPFSVFGLPADPAQGFAQAAICYQLCLLSCFVLYHFIDQAHSND